MKRQKRIAIINDISGFGRCSVTVAHPIISTMKIQCCALPTAILSSHTGFKGYVFDDYTDKMKGHMEHWLEMDLLFDGIGTGFLGSEKQIQIVIDFIHSFKRDNTIVLVDPIMGDHGILYPTYTEPMCHEMERLVRFADVLTPNLTEACRLLDIPYIDTEPDVEVLSHIARGLSDKGPDKVVITGIRIDEHIVNFVYEKGRGDRIFKVTKVGDYRSGTGDVFSSIVIGDLVNGNTFEHAVEKAVNFISKAAAYTNDLQVPSNEGLCFEEYLHELAE